MTAADGEMSDLLISDVSAIGNWIGHVQILLY